MKRGKEMGINKKKESVKTNEKKKWIDSRKREIKLKRE